MQTPTLSKNLARRDLRPGDVILCYSPDMREDRPGRESGYSHAAICTDTERILESAGGGVQYTNVSNLLDEYNHLAVLRNTGAWDEGRLRQLRSFAEESVGKPFNLEGLKAYDQTRFESLATQLERIAAYFAHQQTSPFNAADQLFCSELVVTAFIICGIIRKSAVAAFDPAIFLPQDLAKDMLFGFFAGYMLPYSGYQLPADDYFKSYADDPHFLREVRGL